MKRNLTWLCSALFSMTFRTLIRKKYFFCKFVKCLSLYKKNVAGGYICVFVPQKLLNQISPPKFCMNILNLSKKNCGGGGSTFADGNRKLKAFWAKGLFKTINYFWSQSYKCWKLSRLMITVELPLAMITKSKVSEVILI